MLWSIELISADRLCFIPDCVVGKLHGYSENPFVEALARRPQWSRIPGHQ